MPLYGYRCTNCEHEFDRVLAHKDSNKVFCPNCQERAKKLLSCGSFILDNVMASKHSNSPEGQARASELRKKHIKKHTHKDFKAENTARAKRDGKFTYGES